MVFVIVAIVADFAASNYLMVTAVAREVSVDAAHSAHVALTVKTIVACNIAFQCNMRLAVTGEMPRNSAGG